MKNVGMLLLVILLISGINTQGGVVDWRGGVTSYPDPILDLDAGTAAPNTLTETELGVDCTVTLLAGSSGFIAGDSDKDWGNDSLEALFELEGPGTNLNGPRHAMAGGNGEKYLEFTFSSTTKTTYLFVMDVDYATDYCILKDGNGDFLPASRFVGVCDNEDGKAPLASSLDGLSYDETIGKLFDSSPASHHEYVAVFDVTGLGTVLTTHAGGNQFAVGIGLDSFYPTPVYPLNEQEDVEVSGLTLTWNKAIDEPNTLEGYYVYLSQANDPNLLNISPAYVDADMDTNGQVDATSSYLVPVTLSKDATYYWRVDQKPEVAVSENDPNVITGRLWEFDTEKTIVVIDPVADVDVAAGNDAVFTAMFTSASDLTLNKWYRVGDPDVEIIDDDVNYDIQYTWNSGTQSGSSTLTIYSADITDMGDYYCTLDNNASVLQTSNTAALIVRGLLAHYTFDSTLADFGDGAKDGTAGQAGIAYDTTSPIVGAGALVLSGDPNSYVELPLSAYPNGSNGGGLETGTVAMWVKLVNHDTTVSLIGATNDDSETPENEYITAFSIDCQGDAVSNDLRCFLRDDGGENVVPSASLDSNFKDGQWHQVAWTCDSGTTVLYFDGVEIATATHTAAVDSLSPWVYPMVIGAANSRGDVVQSLEGSIDDVQIYNIVLTPEQIVDEYNLYQEPDVWICQGDYNVYDMNEDCQVDLLDLSDFAANWLVCDRYPVSNCN